MKWLKLVSLNLDWNCTRTKGEGSVPVNIFRVPTILLLPFQSGASVEVPFLILVMFAIKCCLTIKTLLVLSYGITGRL